MTEEWRSRVGDEGMHYLGVLWGKSGRHGDGVNLLIQHLFDAMSVGEVLWDSYLADGPRSRIAAVAGGNGRRFLSWLCAAHDVGKASPAFQSQDADLAVPVEAAGLVGAITRQRIGQRWRHELAGALILRERLSEEWGDQHQVEWLWPLVAGHHGAIPAVGKLRRRPRERRETHGSGDAWDAAHRSVVDAITAAAGYPDVQSVRPVAIPNPADQLLLGGLVVMADWVASNTSRVKGIADIDRVSVAEARLRARATWDGLGLRGGWRDLPVPSEDLLQQRFGMSSRPAQTAALAAAEAMTAPGLLVIEAPTGEGKTEISLGAAEKLAQRFGAGGLYYGLPTQATSDPMFTRVRRWLGTFDAPPPIALLHGKRRFNREWMALEARSAPKVPAQPPELDEHGMVDEPPSIEGDQFGDVCEDGCDDPEAGAAAAARWFLGQWRGLLAANVVGTIDQLLYAGTCTRYVMVRYAGLAGKVVVLDEVHAADDYMSVFLDEVLRWLGTGRVPVVLLSATLAPAQRRRLVKAYLEGATSDAELDVSWVDDLVGYPSALAAWVEGDEVHHVVESAPPWRSSRPVSVEVLAERPDGADDPVCDLLSDRLRDGGCALVIRNTVGRAQSTFDALRGRFGSDEIVLLHGRLAAGARAETTDRLVAALGPDAKENRPKRMVVVATQVAEQSFDIDADILVTDLAPVDLLVQRVGRLHRHERDDRPAAVASPVVVVTGVATTGDVPSFERAFELIYGQHLLLQTFALVREAEVSGWSLPSDAPGLVARAYGEWDLGPADWAEAQTVARVAHTAEVERRRSAATEHRLTRRGREGRPTLEGLHASASTARDVESQVRVRDGEMGVDVVLVRWVEGRFLTLDGRDLGPNGDAALDISDEILAWTVRLPAYGHFEPMARAAGAEPPLPGWIEHPWLRWMPVLRLELDGGHRAELGGVSIAYDPHLGLLLEPTR